MARSSAARKLSAIRQFHRFLHGDGLAMDNPATAIDSPRAARPLPKMISQQDVNALAETARSRVMAAEGKQQLKALRLLSLIELLYATGLRVSELVGLTAQAAGAERDFILVKGKGGRERLVPVSATAQKQPVMPTKSLSTGGRKSTRIPDACQGSAVSDCQAIADLGTPMLSI